MIESRRVVRCRWQIHLTIISDVAEVRCRDCSHKDGRGVHVYHRYQLPDWEPLDDRVEPRLQVAS